MNVNQQLSQRPGPPSPEASWKGASSLTVLHGLSLPLFSWASSLSLPLNAPCSTFLSFMEFAVMTQLSPTSLQSVVVVAAHRSLATAARAHVLAAHLSEGLLASLLLFDFHPEEIQVNRCKKCLPTTSAHEGKIWHSTCRAWFPR